MTRETAGGSVFERGRSRLDRSPGSRVCGAEAWRNTPARGTMPDPSSGTAFARQL